MYSYSLDTQPLTCFDDTTSNFASICDQDLIKFLQNTTGKCYYENKYVQLNQSTYKNIYYHQMWFHFVKFLFLVKCMFFWKAVLDWFFQVLSWVRGGEGKNISNLFMQTALNWLQTMALGWRNKSKYHQENIWSQAKSKFSLVGFNDTIRLYKRQGCVTDSCPVRESQDYNLMSSLDY